jgi:hypothetical protein
MYAYADSSGSTCSAGRCKHMPAVSKTNSTCKELGGASVVAIATNTTCPRRQVVFVGMGKKPINVCMSVAMACHGVSAYLSVYGMCVSAYLSASVTAQMDMRVLYPSHAWYAFLTMSCYEFLALRGSH